jgi:signal transduction histidine kinase
MYRLAQTSSFRLAIIFALIFAACFSALLIITFLTTSSTMREQVRDRILEDSRWLIAEITNDGLESATSDIGERLQHTGSTAYYYLSGSNGQKLAGNLSHMTPFEGWREGPFNASEIRDVYLTDDVDQELWGQGTKLADGSFLFVGQNVVSINMSQKAIIRSFAWSIGIAFLVALIAGIIASRQFLRRIDAINKTSSAIIKGNLKERIPVRGTFDEMDRLSVNLNKLFDSNQSLLESLTQVTTNIAHDLRSPLSRLRQGLEASKKAPASRKSYERAVDAAIVECDRLLKTFSGLLRIAQIESGSRKAGFRQIKISALIQRIASIYAPVAEHYGKELHASVAPDLLIEGDGELLLQMFVNLVENAIRHTPAKTKIELRLGVIEGHLAVEIADSGEGIPADEREKVFERFYRLDKSRSTSGSGLGLSLANAIARLHGVHIALEDNCPGLRAVITFPIRPDRTGRRAP